MKPDPRDRPQYGDGPSYGPWLVAIVVLALVAAATYYYWPRVETLSDQVMEQSGRTGEEAGTPAESGSQPSDEQANEPEEPQYPVPDTATLPDELDPDHDAESQAGDADDDTDRETDAERERADRSLPPLEESDASVRESVQTFVPENRFEELFIPESLIRHFVVTIDNMTREKLPEKYDFTQPPPDTFKVREVGDEEYELDPANYERYERFVLFAESVNLDQVVSLYTRYYPLFQQAYEELGYPDRYFNDRLVKVLEHLLAMPDIEQPVELVRPNVFYKFADPELEDMSAGHKLMVRIGPDNAARIKQVMRGLRERLTSLEARQLD